MHGPFPPPFPNVKDCPSELPARQTKELQIWPLSTCPAVPSGARDPHASQASLRGTGCPLSRMLCGPPATHPPTQERCLSTSPHPGLMMAQLPSGEDIITPQAPPITPEPSVAFTAPPGPGPLAKANAFEKSSPSSHTELHPKPTGPAPGRQLHFRPQGLRQGAAPRTAGPPQGVSRAGLCGARGCGPSPATRVGAPAFFPL